MLSEDFALVGANERKWEDWYDEEIVHREMYKTLFYSYKGRMYQFQPVGWDEGNVIGGKVIKQDSYLFVRIKGEEHKWEYDGEPEIYDSFKDAVDNAKMDDGKTLKEIWYDSESFYKDFM